MRLHDSAHARPRSNKPSRSPFFWASARFPCYAVRGLTGVQLLAWWLIVAGGLVKIPQLVDRGAGIPPAFFSARKESRWSRKETLGVAEVGIASSGTARKARGSGGLPFYGRTHRYERRKCAAVPRGAGDAAWWESWCGARGAGFFLAPFIAYCKHCLSAESTPFLSALPERNAVEPQRKGRLVKGLPPLNSPRRCSIRQRLVPHCETHRLGARESVQCGIPCKRLKLQLSSAVCFYALSVYLALQAKIPTNPRLPHPAARRRTCAARTGSSERRKVSPRNRALCARFRKKRCLPPHPPAFLSGSTGFLFALKRKRVDCLHYLQRLRYINEDTSQNPAPCQRSHDVNNCGTVTKGPAPINHPRVPETKPSEAGSAR